MDNPTHLDGLAKPEGHVPPLEMISTHTHTHFADVSTHVNPTGMLGGQWVHAICDYSKLSNSTAQLADSRLMNTSSRTPPVLPPHHVCVLCVCVTCACPTHQSLSTSYPGVQTRSMVQERGKRDL